MTTVKLRLGINDETVEEVELQEGDVYGPPMINGYHVEIQAIKPNK